MQLTVEIPFGEATLQVNGDYSPYVPGRNYLANGDPGYPDEPSDFEPTEFYIEGLDISEQLNIMYVKNKAGFFVDYVTSIMPRLQELADEAYPEYKEACEEHCGNGYYSKWY